MSGFLHFAARARPLVMYGEASHFITLQDAGFCGNSPEPG